MKTNEEEMGGDIQSEMLKKNIYELQGQLQESYKRIKELTEELTALKKQNNYERSREVYDKLQFTGHKSKRDTEVL